MNRDLDPLAAVMQSVTNVLSTSFDGRYGDVDVRITHNETAFIVFAKTQVRAAGSMEVASRGSVLRYRSPLAVEPARTGDRIFDEVFRVRASNPCAALTELTVALRSCLVTLATKCGDVRIEDDYLRAVFPSATAAAGALDAFADVVRAMRDTPRTSDQQLVQE